MNRDHLSKAGAVLVCLLACTAFTLGATELKLGSQSGLPGAVVFMPVALETVVPVVAAQFDLVYNAATLASEGILGGEGIPGLSFHSREIGPGTRRVLLYSRGSAPLPGSLVLNMPLRISAGAPAGTSTLSVTNALLSDAQGQRVAPIAFSSGQVEIRSGSGPQFTAVAVDPIGNVHLQMKGIPGTPYLMQMSSDFRTWTLLSGNAPFSIDGLLTVTDTNLVKPPHRFYRAVVSP